MLGIKPSASLPDAIGEVVADRGDDEQNVEELQDVEEHLPKILPVSETYHFVTDWHFQAPLEKVWSVVPDIYVYPGWWKNVRHVKITRGDGKSVGSVIECEVRGSLPYSLKYALEVREAEEYRHILLRSTGDLIDRE